jgi:hypothetical protein
MTSRIDDLLTRITGLEREVEAELDRRRTEWRYRIDAGRVRFEHEVHLAYRRLKQGIPRFLRESSIPNDIARVRRSQYVVIDRQHLAYLNAIERLNCMLRLCQRRVCIRP